MDAIEAVGDSLLRRAAAGDLDALALLVREHSASMARVAYVVTGDLALAEDAVQAAWARAWRRLGSVRDPDRLQSWLVAVAANEARMVVRARRRRPVVRLAVMDVPAVRSDPSERIALVDLERVLGGLDADDRALLALRYVAELESSEIAARLGLSSSGVRSRLDRLRARLRRELADD